MHVDVRVILSGPFALIIAATLTTVAIASKWIAAFFTQIVFRYTGAQRQLIFGLSGAHAAATLAVIIVGYNAGILDDNILNGTIILILITCVVASFATEKASRKIMVESEDDETEYKRISGQEHVLVPIASSENIEKLLEFSIFIKDKKSPNPISILSVVTNNDEAEKNIVKTRNKLEDYVRQASASETNVNVITTIDHNVASGIARISREIMADLIVLGWPRPKKGIFDKFLGRKMDILVSNTDKATFICHLEKPLILHKRIVVAIPEMAEYEKGFEQWLIKVATLAQELTVPIQLYCSSTTEKAVKKVLKEAKLSATTNNLEFSDWEDFLILARYISEDDLFILVSARKGTASYNLILENLPSKLEKHFFTNSRIILYPAQNISKNIDLLDDINAESLNKGIETIQKIGKGIGNIFKNE